MVMPGLLLVKCGGISVHCAKVLTKDYYVSGYYGTILLFSSLAIVLVTNVKDGRFTCDI